MPSHEYRVVPAPRKGLKVKGARKPEERFARAVETEMNRMAEDGWEFVRSDTLPSEQRQGWFSRPVTVFQTVLVFRRAQAVAADAPRAAMPPPVALTPPASVAPPPAPAASRVLPLPEVPVPEPLPPAPDEVPAIRPPSSQTLALFEELTRTMARPEPRAEAKPRPEAKPDPRHAAE